MTKLPSSDKCDVECLLDYRFEFLIHCCDYHKEMDMLSLGTSKGQLLNYDIGVEPDSIQHNYWKKDEGTKGKKKVRFNGPEIVYDKDK